MLAPITLGVGAICIDQDNDEERAQQVMMMRDIYWNAKGVVTWLGPGTESSRKAMKLIGLSHKNTPRIIIRSLQTLHTGFVVLFLICAAMVRGPQSQRYCTDPGGLVCGLFKKSS